MRYINQEIAQKIDGLNFNKKIKALWKYFCIAYAFSFVGTDVAVYTPT